LRLLMITALFCCTSSGTLASAQLNPGHATHVEEDGCGSVPSQEHIELIRQRISDGTWETATQWRYEDRGIDAYVPITAHVVRYDDGSGGIPQSRIDVAIDDLNDHVASTGLAFYQMGDTIYMNDSQYAELDSDEFCSLVAIDSVPQTVNIYFVPDFVNLCGRGSFTTNPCQGVVMDNDCTATSSNHSTFSHEVAHYFNLYHTHTTYHGVECVDGSNCATAGDVHCDTPADPNLSGVVDDFCNYTGTELDECGSGMPYAPPTTNLMSYSRKWCRTHFTQEQLSLFAWTAHNDRSDHLEDAGACCMLNEVCVETIQELCLSVGGTYLAGQSCDDEVCSEQCDADLTGDDHVGVDDLLAVIAGWQNPYTVDDLLLVISSWGPCE